MGHWLGCRALTAALWLEEREDGREEREKQLILCPWNRRLNLASYRHRTGSYILYRIITSSLMSSWCPNDIVESLSLLDLSTPGTWRNQGCLLRTPEPNLYRDTLTRFTYQSQNTYKGLHRDPPPDWPSDRTCMSALEGLGRRPMSVCIHYNISMND
jgi:hypothetical protein